MGIIKETEGKILLADKLYVQSHVSLREAFKFQVDSGDFNAKQTLKLWILSSILSEEIMSPASTSEARSYEADLQVKEMF